MQLPKGVRIWLWLKVLERHQILEQRIYAPEASMRRTKLTYDGSFGRKGRINRLRSRELFLVDYYCACASVGHGFKDR